MDQAKFAGKRARIFEIALASMMAAFALLLIIAPSFAAGGTAPGNVGAGDQPDATCPAGGQCFADVIQGGTFYDYVNLRRWGDDGKTRDD